VFAIGVGWRWHVGGRLHSRGAGAAGAASLDPSVVVVSEKAVEAWTMREALCGGSADPAEALRADEGEEGARGRLADVAAMVEVMIQKGRKGMLLDV
jgi:hypothetical protein